MKTKHFTVTFSICLLALSTCTMAEAFSKRELLQKPITVQDGIATEIQLDKPISRNDNVVELDVEFDTATIVKYTYRTGGINLSRGLTELTITFISNNGIKYSTKKSMDSFYDNGVYAHFRKLPPPDVSFNKALVTGKNLPQINQIYWLDETTYSNTTPLDKATSQAPVIIEGEVIGAKGCDKYCLYNVKLVKVIKNISTVKLDSEIKVARLNTLSQPKLNERYVLKLDLYNGIHPEYGLKILGFTKNENPTDTKEEVITTRIHGIFSGYGDLSDWVLFVEDVPKDKQEGKGLSPSGEFELIIKNVRPGQYYLKFCDGSGMLRITIDRPDIDLGVIEHDI